MQPEKSGCMVVSVSPARKYELRIVAPRVASPPPAPFAGSQRAEPLARDVGGQLDFPLILPQVATNPFLPTPSPEIASGEACGAVSVQPAPSRTLRGIPRNLYFRLPPSSLSSLTCPEGAGAPPPRAALVAVGGGGRDGEAARTGLVYHPISEHFHAETISEKIAEALVDHAISFQDEPVCRVRRLRRDWVVEKLCGSEPANQGEDRKPRGNITEHSQRSRLNMVLFLKNCDCDFYSMLTLTMPKEFPSDGKLAKQMLHTMIMWIRRQGVRGVWFLEFQKRGAPHFHLLLDWDLSKNLSFVARRKPKRGYSTDLFLQSRCAARWAKIYARSTGIEDPKHEIAGCSLEHIEKNEGALRYAAKHGAKVTQKLVPDGYQNVGRFWGHFGIDALPDGEILEMTTFDLLAKFGADVLSSRGRVKKILYDAESRHCGQSGKPEGEAAVPAHS